MKSKQIFFYATSSDLLEMVNFIEKSFDIFYYEAGLLNIKSNAEQSLKKILETYVPEYGSWNFNKMYLIYQNIKLYT